MSIYLDPSKRHDFIWLVDVKNGNPNGDPDAENLPRTDPQTMHGFMTDVCLKRKIRNYAALLGQPIFVEQGSILNKKIEESMTANDISPGKGGKSVKDSKDVDTMRRWMCDRYYDVRMFGAVMSTGRNAGQVRGPLQITFADSIDTIVPSSISITRCAATEGEEDKDNKTMGRKTFIPYGLYRAYGFFSPTFAEQTGVGADDLKLFWDALLNCWECDRSAARGFMATRKLIVFSHESKWGNAPAHELFNLFKIASQSPAPRSFEEYEWELNAVPESVTATVLR
ncbi:type I-C CRISPR-associated protein Cas7/Csd2 [Laspinema sp. D1]|uniref:Type I-C CRISPR-associated protein Cas7/Csd2 n=1 Tax=Laspinema palackyanum D2a TaxID=2953684 RepID=A0ABT2MTP4_9CYAN|nr:type I-C CRISPR-associated protein Cas7/Csd2 [Laspinema sp. D2a]